MAIITTPASNVYYNLNTLTGFTPDKSLVITNTTIYPLYLARSATQPSPGAAAITVYPGQDVRVDTSSLPVWISAHEGLPVTVQQLGTDSIFPLQAIDYPHDIYTSPKELYRRIKVDPGQTSFHDGREFRTFYEFSIGAGTSQYIRAVVGVNTILYNVSIQLDAAQLRLTTLAGATGTGAYDVVVPVIPKNTMSNRSQPFYVSQNTLHTGATAAATGGTVIDTVRTAAGGSSNKQASVGSAQFDQRGVGTGTYFWRLHNYANGTATGVFTSFWAELVDLGI